LPPSRPRDDRGFNYAPFYCEENVFHLAQDAALAARPRSVVFISNEARTCAVWSQRAAVRAHWPILWDYHVVLLCAEPWEIWDLDTTLPLPCAAGEYLRRSFRAGVGPELLPRFRVVEAGLFTRVFASDRSHMRTETGEFSREPPPWPLLGAPGAASNLASFVDVATPFVGEVLDLPGLLARIADA
jgi:hypothetical protein